VAVYWPQYFFYLTLIDAQPVSYRCLSTLVRPGVGGFVRLRPDQIFMVDEFTIPAFRRRGITRRMAIAVAPAVFAQGFHEVVGIHRVDNDDTVAAAAASRWRPAPGCGRMPRRRCNREDRTGGAACRSPRD
jgi:hypothetical protein